MTIKGQTRQSERHVESVLAACDIVDSFLRFPDQTLKQIINQTHLTRNRVMRLTGTLVARGYLLRDSRTGIYNLGPRVMSLGRVYERQSNLANLAQPILQELAKATGESASINVLDNLDRVVLAREEGTNQIRLSVSVGQRVPVHLGTSGKVILAFSPKEVMNRVLKRIYLNMLDSEANTAASKLASELKKIKTQGYAYGQAARVPDAGVIAVPIFGSEKCFLGALVIAGPVHRFTPETLPEKIKLIMTAAAKLSWQLGGDQALPSN